MTDDRDLLIQALKAEIDELPDRCPGYHKAVRDALVDIVGYERENRMAKIPIVQKTKETAEVLARFVQTQEDKA